MRTLAIVTSPRRAVIVTVPVQAVAGFRRPLTAIRNGSVRPALAPAVSDRLRGVARPLAGAGLGAGAGAVVVVVAVVVVPVVVVVVVALPPSLCEQ